MSLKDKYICPSDKVSATINDSASLSDAINLGGLRLFGLVVPSTWSEAKISFQVSFDGYEKHYDLHDKDGEVAYTVTPDSYIELEAEKFASIQSIKIRSGLSSATVPQTSSAEIDLVLRSI